MKLTHTADHSLTCLLVGCYLEGRVFFSKLLQAHAQAIQVLLSLWLNCNTDYRIREVHCFEHDWRIFSTQSITCADILETYTGTDITATDSFHRVLLVRVHLEQTRDTFLLARTCIQYVATCIYLTWVHTEEYQTTYIWVSSNLKCKCTHWLFEQRLASDYFVRIVHWVTFYIFRILRAWKICTHCIEKWLNALVLKRATTHHRHNHHLQCSCTQCTAYFFFGDGRWIIEIFFHQCIIIFCDCLKELIAPRFAFFYHVGRNFFYHCVSTEAFIRPVESLHCDKVYHTLKGFLCTDWQVDWAWICSQHFAHLAAYFIEVGTAAVHLVYISYTWHIIFVGLTPYSFWLRLYTTYGTECCHSTIEHA